MDVKSMAVAPGRQDMSPNFRYMFETLPGFIKGWAITYLVFAGIWCAVAMFTLTITVWMQCLECPAADVAACYLYTAAVALTGGLGLYGNILLLSKKPRAVTVGRCLIVLTILHILWNAFQLFGAAYWGPEHLTAVLITVGSLMTAGRITLLVFYWIAISRAARYFEARRQQMGF